MSVETDAPQPEIAVVRQYAQYGGAVIDDLRPVRYGGRAVPERQFTSSTVESATAQSVFREAAALCIRTSTTHEGEVLGYSASGCPSYIRAATPDTARAAITYDPLPTVITSVVLNTRTQYAVPLEEVLDRPDLKGIDPETSLVSLYGRTLRDSSPEPLLFLRPGKTLETPWLMLERFPNAGEESLATLQTFRVLIEWLNGRIPESGWNILGVRRQNTANFRNNLVVPGRSTRTAKINGEYL